MEICWTGVGSMLKGDFTLQGFSYLWMFPIYGLAVFFEPVHEQMRNTSWFVRGLFWMILIFSAEFLTGLFIKSLTGVVPWDYTGSSPFAVGGLIRLDYAPVWFLVGLIFEQVHDFIKIKVD